MILSITQYQIGTIFIIYCWRITTGGNEITKGNKQTIDHVVGCPIQKKYNRIIIIAEREWFEWYYYEFH